MSKIEFKLSLRKMTGEMGQFYPRIDSQDKIRKVMLALDPSWLKKTDSGVYSPYRLPVLIRTSDDDEMDGNLTCATTLSSKEFAVAKRKPLQLGITIKKLSDTHKNYYEYARQSSEDKEQVRDITATLNTDTLTLFLDFRTIAYAPKIREVIRGVANAFAGKVAEANKKDKSTYLYAVQSGDKLIKFGCSTNPEHRPRGMTTGNAVKLTFLGKMIGSKKDEEDLKRKFQDVNTREALGGGWEWYFPSVSLMKFIADNMK